MNGDVTTGSSVDSSSTESTTGSSSEGSGTEGSGTASTAPVRRKNAGIRRLVESLVFELGIPLGSYYLMLGLGVAQLAALVVSSLLTAPWLVYGLIKRGRVEAMPVFTLVLLVIGALMSLITGSPRALLIRDSWLFGVVGLWILGSLATRRPFMLSAGRSVVSAKLGEEGATAWAGRWDTEPSFPRHIRVLTAVWGAGFAVDALIRVAFACTLPVSAVPLVNSLQWLVVLGGLFGFHYWYASRKGLLA